MYTKFIKGHHIRLVIALFYCITLGITNAQIITVKQDGTGDYLTIQQGINAAIDGDTVLVWPGIYIENVNFLNKSIALASLNLTTNDSAYINQTVIDGNNAGTCVMIENIEHTALVYGFTITNGSKCGIRLDESEARIANCKIVNNVGLNGGGIYIYNSNVIIHNSIISGNFVNQNGGGIYIVASDVFMSKTTISYNHCYIWGGGILIAINSSVTFDTSNLCNIYYNFAADGSDIFKVSMVPPLDVVVDTFTVIAPDSYHLYSNLYDSTANPPQEFNLNIQHGKTEMVNADLYVNPSGDNNNSGLTPEEPLKNIVFALTKIVSDSMHPNTIHLADGIYSPSNGAKFPMDMRSFVSIEGTSTDYTILDAEYHTSIIAANRFKKTYALENMTIKNGYGGYHGFYQRSTGVTMIANQNIVVDNMLFTKNKGILSVGYGISRCDSVHINNCKFVENLGLHAFHVSTSYFGNEFEWFTSDSIVVTNCSFINNQPNPDTDEFGGAGSSVNGTLMYNDSLNVYFINCEFIDNNHYSEWPQYAWTALGGGNSAKITAVNCTFTGNHSDNSNVSTMGVVTDSELNLYNCILYDNQPRELYMFSYDDYDWDTCKLNIYNSLVAGGEENILKIGAKNPVFYAPTNIDTDPMFFGEGDYPYSLDYGSPCINAGTLDLPPEIELHEYDLAGNTRVYDGYIDMGAYEHGPWVGIGTPNVEHRLTNDEVLGARPNPFVYGTYISYEMPEAGSVNISVYDMQGKLTAVLLDGFQPIGNGEFYWDGSGRYASKLPAGVYVLRMVVNEEVAGECKLIRN